MLKKLLPAIFLLSACQPSLDRQAKINPYREAPFFSDHAGARPRVEGTVAYGSSQTPVEITAETLHRGKELFEIHCAVCHGFTGKGDGLATERGFPPPPSLNSDEVKKLSLVETVKIIDNGDGPMFGFANRLSQSEEDQIAHYVAALILSQSFPADRLTATEKSLFGGSK